LIAGVANHEARRAYDARVERLRHAFAQARESELERQLCDAVLLGLWRARSVIGFATFVQDVIGLQLERAQTLCERDAARRGVALERLPDVAVALWLRSEAALLEHCPEAQIELQVEDGGRLRLVLSLPLHPPVRAAEAVAAIGRSASGLVRVLTEPARAPRERES
jgi:hypothetical protein